MESLQINSEIQKQIQNLKNVLLEILKEKNMKAYQEYLGGVK
jgi:hypothetical protein